MGARQQDYDVRFRHVAGDVGPFKLPPRTTVAEMKEKVLEAWPLDGPLASNAPTSVETIRIINAGKFADNGQTLGALCASLGPPTSELIVTLHVIVRPPSAGKGSSAAQGAKDYSARTCWCVIC